jgi:hypothetical protein
MSETTTQGGDTTALWAAVHKLNRPSKVKIDRQRGTDSWLTELADQVTGACRVDTYRSANVVWATIPSLWDQSTAALYGSGGEEGRGTKPLRERSVADLNLLEIRAQIVEAVRAGCEAHGERTKRDKKTGQPAPFRQEEVSRYASLMVAKEPDQIEFVAFRIASWCRALETYLNAAEHEVRDVRLRNSPCPTCGTGQVTIDQGGDVLVVPALLIKFHNGLVQGAVCEACGDVWWRGDDLERLATLLGVGIGDSAQTRTA